MSTIISQVLGPSRSVLELKYTLPLNHELTLAI